MKKTFNTLSGMLVACAAGISLFAVTGCKDGETYAEQKEKERNSINAFLDDNDIVGKVEVINEEQFAAQDSTTILSRNQFVRFNEDGIYMQIVRKSDGPTIREMARTRPDSTITTPIICKFFEYDIQNADTTYSNYYNSSLVEKMQCTYSLYSRSYTAHFSDGQMKAAYGTTVPKGWLKPLDFIRLTKVAGEEAKVRVIVPHSSGTSNASGHVQPFYYEITYQIPPNQ